MSYICYVNNGKQTHNDMNNDTTINYYKNIESACKSFGYNCFNEQMDILNFMRKKNTVTFRIADEMITVTYDANNYPGANKYMVEITY